MLTSSRWLFITSFSGLWLWLTYQRIGHAQAATAAAALEKGGCLVGTKSLLQTLGLAMCTVLSFLCLAS